MSTKKFLIPDGIEYYTGADAILFEKLKFSVLNIFKKYKYEFVVTPVIDSINNLNNLNGDNLKSYTTSLSGKKELGIRADITPQISRLDYQSYQSNKSNKFSYMGEIYRETKSSFDRNSPFQVGAEYFGKITKAIDIDLIKMCHEIICLSRANKIFIELNDSFFINRYLDSIKLNIKDRAALVNMISLKSVSEINNFFSKKKVKKNKIQELFELMDFCGSITLLKKINSFSKRYNYKAAKNIKYFKDIIDCISSLRNVEIIIDLTSFKSMDYEKGFSYTFYVDKLRKPIALGGSYEAYTLNDDSIRHATGFSIDLKDIVTIYEK